VREGIYKAINAKNYDKGAMVARVVRHAWYVWGGLGFKSCVCH